MTDKEINEWFKGVDIYWATVVGPNQKVEWHRYPNEKPKAKAGTKFLVFLSNGWKDESYWRGEPNFEWQYYDDADVIAWAELPKAYEP